MLIDLSTGIQQSRSALSNQSAIGNQHSAIQTLPTICPLDVDAESALVVLEAIVVDSEEQLTRGRHRDLHATADAERLPVATDAANQRTRWDVWKRRVRRLTS